LAESNGQEKTEQPTGKRIKENRQKGNVFQSKDICTVIMLFGAFFMIRMMIPYIYQTTRTFMEWVIGSLSGDLENLFSGQLFTVMVLSFLQCALPLLLVSVVLGIISHGVQTRFNVSFYVLKPKFKNLNPISGIKRLFSLKKVVELLKSVIKIILLLALMYNLLKEDLSASASMIDMYPMNAAIYMLNMVYDLVIRVCIGFTVIAFVDYIYQRWDYNQNIKMTKQEVKDEFKNTEGNPEIKGRIRRLQREMAMSRMMQKVPNADVIIKNPTHFAVALRYNPDQDRAPVVLAKGQDELALRIIKTGEQHGVFVLENRPLARALYASCELDREIPAEFYGAVAEVLVYVYRASNREDILR